MPEQPGEKRISIHWLALVFGVAWLAVGLGLVRSYFRLTGPRLSELHELRLADVTNVVAEPESPGSPRIGRIWLRTAKGARIRYQGSFPYASQIRGLNPDYGLLLDQTNAIWGVTTGGKVLAGRYFQEYNIENKRIGKTFGPIFTFFGLVLLFGFIVLEAQVLAGKPLPESVGSMRVRPVILWASLIAYLIFWFAVIYPLLAPKVGGLIVGLVWVLGAGFIGNGIVAYFKKHPPSKGKMLK